jgi:hypothetical protein
MYPIKGAGMGYGMLNTKSQERKTIDLLLPVFLMGVILLGSGCVTTLHFVDAKKKSSTSSTETSGGTTTGGGTTTDGGTTGGGTTTGGTTPETQPDGTQGGTTGPQEQYGAGASCAQPTQGGTTGGTQGGTQPVTGTPPQQQPTTTIKGPIQLQECAASGIVALVDCQQVMNIKNIHNTVVRGSNYAIGAPGTSANGATPTVLYVPGVGYVELTGIQNAGNGQATITYFVLVPTK